jgi:hypothetical protein
MLMMMMMMMAMLELAAEAALMAMTSWTDWPMTMVGMMMIDSWWVFEYRMEMSGLGTSEMGGSSKLRAKLHLIE